MRIGWFLRALRRPARRKEGVGSVAPLMDANIDTDIAFQHLSRAKIEGTRRSCVPRSV